MSDAHLPDDVSQWPKDPYLLLGIDDAVDHHGLRLAYVRLIRIYRPEHFPEQFRRIREAYDELAGSLRYQRQYDSDAPAPEPPEQLAAAAANASEEQLVSHNDTTVPPASVLKPETPTVPPVDAAWALARDGRPREAYCQLRELERRQPGNEAICLRLYWLLVLHPDLDQIRDRRDWLVAGLPAAGLSGPLMELYGRELEGDPLESRHVRCRDLLERPTPLSERAAFAMRCWRVLGLAGCWGLIAQNLATFRQQLATADVTTWVRMLLAAKEQFRWQSDQEKCDRMAQDCRREIEEHSEEHQELAWELDCGDSVDALTAGLRTLMHSERVPRATAQQLGELLRRSRVQPFGMIREELLTFLRPIVEKPLQAIESLDGIFQISAAALHQLNLQVQTLYYERCESRRHARRAEERHKAVEAFVQEHKPNVYENWRPTILSFCLRYGMTFDEFAQAAAGVSPSRDLTEAWKTELSLRCITTACAAFWVTGQRRATAIELD
jgi:hypothetical protein